MIKSTKTIAGALLATALSVTGASALTTVNFTTLVTSGLDSSFNPSSTFVGQTGSGSITYDETLPQTVFDFSDLTFSLTMFGQMFSSSDDEFDSASYDSATGDLFFSVSEVSLFNSTAITLDGIESFQFDSAIVPLLGGGNQIEVVVFEGDGTCTTNCGLAPIPLPGTLPLALAGMGLIGWVARRKV